MQTKETLRKIIIGISGSSGAIYGIELLKILKRMAIESHLVISKSANLTIFTETDLTIEEVKGYADYSYSPTDIGSRISSGSFRTDGMIIAPCSMKTLSAIATGYEENLISRAANVVMKEQRKLALMVRETPLHAIHLENMLKLSHANVAICPPVPAFYNRLSTINDLIIHSLTRVLDLFGFDSFGIQRWDGIKKK